MTAADVQKRHNTGIIQDRVEKIRYRTVRMSLPNVLHGGVASVDLCHTPLEHARSYDGLIIINVFFIITGSWQGEVIHLLV